MVSERTLELARAGDERAFRELTEPLRRELQLHCYRILGSTQDAEDALRETLLAAWRGLGQLERVTSLRAWLYRIATSRCLSALRDGKRFPGEMPAPSIELPKPTRVSDVSWLEPYPDELLVNISDDATDAVAGHETTETVTLAFVAALQQLPPGQRAALLLRDVLDFRTCEVAGMLQSTEESVRTALTHARAAIDTQLPKENQRSTPAPNSRPERQLVGRFADAFERGDVEHVVEMLTEDVLLTMPPLPIEYQGRSAAADFLSTVVFGHGTVTYRLIPTRANGQPAFGCYQNDRQCPIARAHGLIALTLEHDGIAALTRFLDNGLLSRFGLPRRLRV